jgi:hypothetical protein
MTDGLSELLAALDARGIDLRVRDGAVVLHARSGAADADLTARVRRHKQELLAHLSQQPRGERPYPASFSQESHWTLHRTAPDSAAYHIFVAARIPADAISAVDQLVPLLSRRHALLRTTYRLVGDRVEAVVRDTLPPPIERISVGECDVIAALERFADRPFDLEREPPVRFAIVEPVEAGTSAYLGLVAHHIAADYRAVQILLQELEQGFRDGPASPHLVPPDDGRRYASFARRQRSALASPEGTALLRTCSDELRGTLPIFEFPSETTRPALQNFSGARLSRTLDATLTAGVRGAARRFGVTPFVLLLTLFSRLLTRYAGHDEIIVGVPISLRDSPEMQDCVADFVNTMPLRLRHRSEESVFACINGVRDNFHRGGGRARRNGRV